MVDCTSGLPIYELTTTAETPDSSAAVDILEKTDKFLSVRECTFIADKGYDVKAIYNTVHNTYKGECVIPLNKRNTKNPKKLPAGNPIAKPVLPCTKTANFHITAEQVKNTAVPLSVQSAAAVLAITRIGTTAEKIADVQST